MKIKFLITGFLTLGSLGASAQKGELNTAQDQLGQYQVARGQKILASQAKSDLAGAKTAIDKASLNAKTSALPLTYALKAAIYANIAVSDSVQTTSAAAFTTAGDALKQAKTLDTKNENTKLIDEANRELAQYSLTQGVTAYQNKKYDDAYKAFDMAHQLLPTDTTIMFNSAISASNAKNYPAAITSYNNLLASNYTRKQDIYNNLIPLYLNSKDTATALKTVNDAVAKYPANNALRREGIEIALQSGKTTDVLTSIDNAITNDPKNKVLYYYKGLTYSQIGDAARAKTGKSKDAAGALQRQNSLDAYSKAADAFKQAVEIDPNYFDAEMNLGYVLMQPAIVSYNAANQLPVNQQKQYVAMRTKANEQFDVSKPYLLKAVELKPNSTDALSNLMNYYRGNSDPAHAAEYKAKAADLKKQIDALQTNKL